MTAGRVDIDGLRQFQASLRKADAELPKRLKVLLGSVSDIVIDYAKPKVPRRSGSAAASITRRLDGRAAKISVGGRKAPYYPWLDFGGEGRKAGRPARRPFITEGRYLYPGLRLKGDEIQRTLEEGFAELARDAGLEVT